MNWNDIINYEKTWVKRNIEKLNCFTLLMVIEGRSKFADFDVDDDYKID